MIRGGAATPEPFDLSEISRSGDLLDGLAARRIPDVASGDPAVRMLAALIADVDAGAPPLPPPQPRVACTAPKPGRPVVRAFVTFGAATLMLTGAGAAVAGGSAAHQQKADGPAVQKLDVSERSTGEVGAHAVPADRRTAPSPVAARPGDPPTTTARGRRGIGPTTRPGPGGTSRPPGGHGGPGLGPVPHAPFGLSSPAPSAPPSPPAASPTPVAADPSPSPPADPHDDQASPPPGSGPGDRTTAHRIAHRPASGAAARADSGHGAAKRADADQRGTTA